MKKITKFFGQLADRPGRTVYEMVVCYNGSNKEHVIGEIDFLQWINFAAQIARETAAQAKRFYTPLQNTDLDIDVDLIDAEHVGVNNDAAEQWVSLTVEDFFRIPNRWRMPPEQAQALGRELDRRATAILEKRKNSKPS